VFLERLWVIVLSLKKWGFSKSRVIWQNADNTRHYRNGTENHSAFDADNLENLEQMQQKKKTYLLALYQASPGGLEYQLPT
jgi:hypothetical protein